MIGVLRQLRHGRLRRFNSVWLVLGRWYRSAVSTLGLSIRQRIGGFGPFRLDAQFAFSNFEHWGAGHNDGFAACVAACRGKRCVIDVGAHIGLVSLPIAAVLGSAGRIVCFEPAEANRVMLRRHLDLNGLAARATIEPHLVGDCDAGDTPFFELPDVSGMNSVAGHAVGAGYRRVMRPQVTLDGYCTRHGLDPEVLKIDVEGAELAVLRGARKTVAKCRPVIFLSVHPRHIAALGSTVEELSDLIGKLGYDCRTCDGEPVGEFALREYVLSPV